MELEVRVIGFFVSVINCKLWKVGEFMFEMIKLCLVYLSPQKNLQTELTVMQNIVVGDAIYSLGLSIL